MRSVKKTLLKGGSCLPLIAVALSGCATVDSGPVIKAGDKVGIHFTCRLPNGEIAAGTDPETVDKSHPVSQIFVKRNSRAPLIVEAGVAGPPVPGPSGKSFEDEIIDRLAFNVVGMKEGETSSVNLVAERSQELPPEEQFVKIARIRKRPKEMKMTKSVYKEKTGRDAAVDQPFTLDPALPGKVANVSGEELVIRFAPVSDEVDSGFGKATVRNSGDEYEIEIHAVKGTLVRTGPLVGRIVDTDTDSIKLDYGHPFGGETLNCDLNVRSVETRKEVATVADTPVTEVVGPVMVKSGDLVTVDYTATLEDGAIFATSSESVAKETARKKVSWYSRPQFYGPEEVIAGKQEFLPGLGEALVGMTAGEKKRITLKPDEAFGPSDPKKLETFPCSVTIPMVVRISAEEYVKRFSSFPVLSREVDLVPYYKSRVKAVTETDVALEALARDGQTVTDGFGTVTITVAGDKVTSTLQPLIGSQFPMKGEMGIIAASDGKTFTVDGNQPLAGKTVVIDLEVVGVTSAAALDTKPVVWIEEHEKGLAKAKEEGKPAVLVLYADWCGFCKKLFAETMPDPRIERIRDKFVWVMVNSDKEKKYKEQYGQNGFPMIVLLKADGTVLKKIDGYRDARELKAELDGVL